MTSSSRLVSGIPAITDALARCGWLTSERTVRRLYKSQKLHGAYKIIPDSRTSPVLMPLDAIEAMARGQTAKPSEDA